jgi:hypothetical protein
VEAGVFALLFGLAAAAVLRYIPVPWLRVAGGALILLTILVIIADVLRLAR